MFMFKNTKGEEITALLPLAAFPRWLIDESPLHPGDLSSHLGPKLPDKV